MTYIIAGGSSGLGRALAETYASKGEDLVLISQDERDTRALAAHLNLVYGTRAVPLAMDLAGEDLPYKRIDDALASLPLLQGILLPVGFNDPADAVGLPDARLETITRANYLSPCKLVNYYLPRLRSGSGTIVGFGSVATARGRSRNAAYAAAKNALETYFQSLRHHAAGSSLTVQFYVLGYLDTNLAFAQSLRLPLGDPQELARRVYRRQKVDGRFFFPGYWRLVCGVVRWLPWTIFKRLSF
jgi:decaprenylphospho-beta-D-erythro-pentofuranosid-2-ulose 2-reductase